MTLALKAVSALIQEILAAVEGLIVCQEFSVGVLVPLSVVVFSTVDFQRQQMPLIWVDSNHPKHGRKPLL